MLAPLSNELKNTAPIAEVVADCYVIGAIHVKIGGLIFDVAALQAGLVWSVEHNMLRSQRHSLVSMSLACG